MVAALALCTLFGLGFWLVFFRFKWLQFSIVWGFVAAFVLLHLLLIFMVGLRFVTPYSTNARMIQETIQLVPRLPEPTLVSAVLVAPNVAVKKGQLLFQFDPRLYEAKVRLLRAKLVSARQGVPVLNADTVAAEQAVDRARAQRVFARQQQARFASLVGSGAVSFEEAERSNAQLAAADAEFEQAQQALDAARAKDAAQLHGVNTAIVEMEADLDQALYYLDNTALVAPEDGRIVNLQVRPGMVSGDIRVGAIASFVCDADRYLLASYFQESLKYVEVGQPVEVAFDLYPGQVFAGKVRSIWRASGTGQLLPSGVLPRFDAAAPDLPQGQFAVAITLDDADQAKFPIGAAGAAAIYTGGGGFAVLRKISIRAYSWLNWFYPLPF